MLYTIQPAYTKDELAMFEELSIQLSREAMKRKWKHEKETAFDGIDREKVIAVFSEDDRTGIVVWTLDPNIVPEEREKTTFQLQVEIWKGTKENASDVDFNLEIEKIVGLDKGIILEEITKLLK